MSWPNRANAEPQTILFLTDKAPIVINVDIKSEGQDSAALWRTKLVELVGQLDKDGSGTLSRKETQALSAARESTAGEPAPAEAQPAPERARKMLKFAPSAAQEAFLKTPNLWDADSEPKDGELTASEIAEFFRWRGNGPFQAEISKESGAVRSPRLNTGNNAGDRLWDWLDDDGNSKISADELKNARAHLAKYDLDSDETISLNELEGSENPFFSARQSNQTSDTPMFVVHRGQSTSRIVRRLISRYASNDGKEKKNAPKENAEKNNLAGPKGLKVDLLNIPQDQRGKYDRDGNGVLDEWELRAYLQSPLPMVFVQVTLPFSEHDEPTISAGVRGETSSLVVKTSATGLVSILAGDVQIELSPDGMRSEMVKQSLFDRFQQADGDNNGYLNENESRRDVFFSQHFKKYDTDGDQNLYPDEWLPAIQSLLDFARGQVRMAVRDSGQDVFSVMDGDRDLKVSPREWLTAADRLSVWDKDENGSLERNEVPHVYRVSFGPGMPDLPGLLTPQVNNNSRLPMTPRLVRGPSWFRAMDTNSDGDVSRNEFLGKAETFGKIDRDQDGLIDHTEAKQFAK